MADADLFDLPSYETARLPDAWPYIVRYLPRRDLVSLALVSKKLQGIAQGLLWSEPRLFWSGEEETIVDELHLFMSALDYSRQSDGNAYSYTQTLDLSSLGSESLSFAFSRGWASRLLSGLPALRSFSISRSEAFDHDSIAPAVTKMQQLRLFSVISCPNLTPKSLQTLLRSTPNLYYLEVAECPRLRSTQLIEVIADLSKLGVLKLPNGGWSDEDILTFTRAVITNRADPNNPFPQNIRSLDLSNNSLSDDVVNTLKFLGEALPTNDEPPPYDADDLDDLESGALISSPENGWSAFFEPRFAKNSMAPIFSDLRADVVKEVRNPGFRSPVEAGELGGGLTHLRLSNNKLSASAIVALLQTLPLEELDCGDNTTIEGTASSEDSAVPKSISSARTILDGISDCPTLKHLRIGYQLVTGFVGCELQDSSIEGAGQDLPPYPYAWLRHQGTQWDPLVIQGIPVKMFQFSPALLALEKLTLTGIPEKVPDDSLVLCLSALMEAAGEMQDMVRLYFARRDGLLPENTHRAPSLGVLKELQLNVLTTLSKEDQYGEDAEAYVDASLNDFSFFPDEKETYAATARQGKASAALGASASSKDTVDMAAVLRQLAEHRGERLPSTSQKPHVERPVWSGRLHVQQVHSVN